MPDWLASEPPAGVASETPAPAYPLPAEPSPDTGPSSAAGPEPSDHAPPRRIPKRLVWTITGVVLGLLIVCVVVAVLVARPYVTGARAAPLPDFLAGERMLVAFPGRGGDDLYLLQVDDAKNDGLVLAQDVAEAAVSVYVASGAWGERAIRGSYGGFIPGKDWLLVWYTAGGVSMLGQMNSRSEAHTVALDSKGDRLYGYVIPKQDRLFLAESRDRRSRCYVARPNGQAARVARGDDCTISLDGSTVFLHDVYSDETMLSVVSIKGGQETMLLDDVVGVQSYRIASDGSRVAYVVAAGDSQQLMVVARRDGEQAPLSDKLHQILDYQYAPGGIDALYYVAREQAEDKEVRLYLSTSERPVDQGESIEAAFTPDGKSIVYLVSGGESSTLHVDPLGEGEKRVVLSEPGIAGVALLDTAPPKLLVPVVQDGETTVYVAGIDGADVVQALKTEAALQSIHYVPGESMLYARCRAAGGSYELHVVSVDGAEQLRVLAGWSEFDLLNRSRKGDRLVFQGRRVDDAPLMLYAVPVQAGAAPVELDGEYQRYESAAFTANGRSILYTARVGDERDALDVVQVDTSGEQEPQLRYEKAYLVDLRWDQLHPFVLAFDANQ
jgi:dipeptidyl aminopeptidase/acylaminoacyl peptidase